MSRTRNDRDGKRMPSGKTSMKRFLKRKEARKVRHFKNFELNPVCKKTIYYNYYW